MRHAWLQKHPTPRAAGGEFHWYAERAARAGDEADDAALRGREADALRGRVVEQVQGLTAPAVWWELSPGRVIWAAVFSAISPTDARPYRGVALTIARGREDDGPSELLAALELARPAPWSERSDGSRGRDGSHGGDGPAHRARAASPARDAGELARAALRGGAAAVEDPHDLRWPARLGELTRLLPPALAQRTWSGQLTDAATRTQARRHNARDGVAELLAAAWQATGEQARPARAAWQLLVELARVGGLPARNEAAAGAASGAGYEASTDAGNDASTDAGYDASIGAGNEASIDAGNEAGNDTSLLRALDETLARSERIAATAHDAELLWRWLDAGERARWSRRGAAPPTSWSRLLHGWGRGWLDEPGGAVGGDGVVEVGDRGDLARAARLADALASRALALLRSGRDAAPVIAEARWHALLPAARRRALLHALACRAPSLMKRPTTNAGTTSNRSRQESVDVA